MLLAFVHCRGIDAPYPDLCMLADKPDQFSVPVPVEALRETDCALFRMGPYEMLRVQRVPEESAIVLDAVTPGKLHLIPPQQDRPGSEVRRLKIVRLGERQYRVLYLQEGRDPNAWKEWNPNQSIN